MIPLRHTAHFATTLAVMVFWASFGALAYWLVTDLIDPNAFLIFGGG